MSGGLAPTETEEVMKEAFDMFDKDGSGAITEQEFAQAVRAIGCNPTEKEIKEFVKKLDKDETGTLDFEEFKHFYYDYKSSHKNDKEDIRNAFKLFDKDGNGFIEAKELKQILQNLGQRMTDEEVQEMISTADIDADGRINYNEFVDFICKPIT